MEKMYINQIMDQLEECFTAKGETLADKAEGIIKNYALAAATTCAASSWVPGVGGTICSAVSVGFVFTMYYKLAKIFNIRIKKNMLKSLASFIVANMAGRIAGSILLMTVGSLIPGIGAVSSSILGAAISYAVVCGAGEIFIYMLNDILKAKKEVEIDALSDMTEEEWEIVAKKVMENVDMEKLLKEGMKSYKNIKKNGKHEDFTDIEPIEE